LGHQGKRLGDALVGEEIQEWGLFELRGETLAKSAVKDGVSGGVGEIGQDYRVLLGEFGGVG
jgi:hypothetical protein